MKNVSLFLIVALALGIFFSGCKKDSETSKNQMTYNGVEYGLSQGILVSYGDGDGTYGYELVLLSSGFTIHGNDSISGTGDGIAFSLYSNGNNNLDVGEYTYDNSSSEDAFTFDFADAVFNWNIDTEEGDDVEATGGKLNVISSGSEYELSMELTVSGGKTITGNYKGSLTYFNDSNSKSIKMEKRWFK